MARYLVAFLPGSLTPTRIKYVDDASDAPDANDDAATLGVTVGSLWLDTTNHRIYIAESVGTGAAVWTELTSASPGSSLFTDLSVSGATDVDRADGATHDLTLTGNATLTMVGAVTGEATDYRLIIRQDGTGSRLITWADTITWVGGSAPTLQTAADAVDTIGLLTVDDGTTFLGYHAGAGGSAGTPATTVESETSFGISAAVGTDTEYARQDHTHGSPALGTSPSTQAFGDAAAGGSASDAAKTDHKHAMPANPVTEAAVQAVGHYELLMTGSGPPEPLEDGTGADWLYVWVNP